MGNTYRTAPPPQQAPLPTNTGDPEEGAPESIKLEHTAKGPRWSIRIHLDPGDDDLAAVLRLGNIDKMMRAKFGEPS